MRTQECQTGIPGINCAPSRFSRLARNAARLAGHPVAFLVALATILIWVVTGPLFAFSDTWQLVINTGTTIVTFLMVFLIQNSQNHDTAAIQVKLDELVRAVGKAENAVLDLETLGDEELERLLSKYRRLALEARTKNEARSEAAAHSSVEHNSRGR